MSASPLHPLYSSAPKSSLRLSLLFPTLLFSLLLASALIHSIASFLNPIHDYLDIHRFSGRRFMSTGVLLISSTTHRNVDGFGLGLGGDENLHCDRSHFRTDVCIARGDVRVLPRGSAESRNYKVILKAQGGRSRQETLRPYTRKWEENVMNTIDRVVIEREVVDPSLGPDTNDGRADKCEVRHEVPAIVFSTGGYTGNVYHEFNDGLIPLFLTAGAYKGEVVLLVLEYHSWWMTKYAEIISRISNHQVIDMATDPRVHCFPELTVGLRIHDELSIDLLRSETRVSMADFQAMLRSAYLPRLQSRAAMSALGAEMNELQEEGISSSSSSSWPQPKLVIVSRKSPRAIVNQEEVASMARDLGFDVQILSPLPTTEMVDIYSALHTCDVMMGVHGAAMTHLLFMRPGTTFIQVVPLGTDWAAATYYGEPAMKLGLDYVQYNVSAFESSLSNVYPLHHPVLSNPNLVNAKGWSETKRIYLEGQDLTLSLPKLRSTLLATRSRIIAAHDLLGPTSFVS